MKCEICNVNHTSCGYVPFVGYSEYIVNLNLNYYQGYIYCCRNCKKEDVIYIPKYIPTGQKEKYLILYIKKNK